MKTILKNISVLALVVGLVFSCSDDDVNYTPKVYAPSSNLTLSAATDFDVDGVTALESSFRVNFSAVDDGVAYYAVFPGGTGTPDIETLIRQTASSFGEGKVALTAGSTETIVISDGVKPGYPYDVHAVMTSVDGIASSGMRVASFTTPDTTAPLFLPGESTPAHETGEYSPFGLNLTLKFSEDVYYKGGDITLTGFFDGAVVVLNEENLASTAGVNYANNEIYFSTNELLGIDDFMLVSFDAGTFADNVGLEVAAVGGFDYYFKIRAYTHAENIGFNLTGLYDWTLVQNIFLPGFPEAGQYEVTSDGDEITVINALAWALGEDNEHVLRVGEPDDDGFGLLFATEIPQESSPGFWGQFFDFSLYWHPYFNDTVTAHAGYYDFITGEIIYLFDLADELGWQEGVYLGSFQYTMLPAASRSSRPEGEGLRNHPVVKKYFEDMEAYRLSQGISQNTTYGPFQLD